MLEGQVRCMVGLPQDPLRDHQAQVLTLDLGTKVRHLPGCTFLDCWSSET